MPRNIERQTIDNQTELADIINNSIAEIREQESIVREKSNELLEAIDNQRTEFLNNGNFSTSVDVLGDTSSGVQITWPASFSKASFNRKEEITENLHETGHDFEECCNVTKSLKLKHGLNEEQLREILGDQFNEIFEIEKTISLKSECNRFYHSFNEFVNNLFQRKSPSISIKR